MTNPATPLVLARKWRPRTFDDMVGQHSVVQALRHALRSGRLHQAYLLTGTRGVGKTTLARLMAKGLNCDSGPTDVPCGQCSACLGIEQGRFADLLEVDAATNTRVEEMRELLENTQYLPVSGRFKIYLIDEVHMLSRSAFNAMLKTLEEPPPHIQFILATTDPQKVPITVLSRCLQFSLRPLSPNLIIERLHHVLLQESLSFEEAALTLLAEAAQGSLRDALSLLDQALAYGAGQVSLDTVRDMLGTIEQGSLLPLLQALAQHDLDTLLSLADEMADHSLSFDLALQKLAVLFHDLALLQAAPHAPALQDSARQLQPWITQWSATTLQLLYQIVVQSRRDLPYAPDERAGFRMALLRLVAFQPDTTPSLPTTTTTITIPPPPTLSHAPPANPMAIDDWPELVGRLKSSGMAYELARHVEWLGTHQHVIKLRLPQNLKHLSNYQEQLRTDLEALLDCDLRLQLEIAPTTTSVAIHEEHQQQTARAQARQSLEQDPFIQQARDVLKARLVESTLSLRNPDNDKDDPS
ncbi:MAG: DNA polymerase III subunit gamma/tau [Betaproteobacteria bacterium]|nr:DNA polymerase III subunit gamma/tau [Betaproteobacteria bacterium]